MSCQEVRIQHVTHTHTEVLVRCPYFQGSNHMQETLVGESNVDKFPQEFSWRGVPLYYYDPVSIWFSLSLSLSLSLSFSLPPSLSLILLHLTVLSLHL